MQEEALEVVVLYLDRVRKACGRDLKAAEKEEISAEEAGWTAQKDRNPERWTNWRSAREKVKKEEGREEQSRGEFGRLYVAVCCRLGIKRGEEVEEAGEKRRGRKGVAGIKSGWGEDEDDDR